MKPPSAGPAPPTFNPFPAVVDIELTSRCNASCSFCPRDQTPHQGLIGEATFTAALRRAVEYRDELVELGRRRPGYFDTHGDSIWLSLCGMGEPLLHPRVVQYVGRIAEAGLRPIINTNGALLSSQTAEKLLDAGLAMACINVGEVGEEYEEVYDLPFERTRANVEHFLAVAPGRCTPMIVMVDHRGDPEHEASVRDYWSRRGADGFMSFGLVNRAGSLIVGEQVEAWHEFGSEATRMLRDRGSAARCMVPFLYPFVGYDGNYYLCSSDWRKEVNLGNVFEQSLFDLFEKKAEHVRTRDPICRNCTHDPTNEVALSLAREPDRQRADLHAATRVTPEWLLARQEYRSGCAAALRAHIPESSDDPEPTRRHLIPVRS